jgi:signal transduction histidine kinase
MYTFIYTLILIIISILFALYTTNPLKKAFKLNDEFIKDILHDINTPLSALRINLKILSREFGNNDAITRSQESIVNILSLQDNMKYYLDQSDLNKEKINLTHIIKEKVNFFKIQNDNIYFILKINEDIFLNTNQNAISRILDNILSNAIKYNKKNGAVTISFKNNILLIEDTGNGIKNTKRIFDRYYKENENGIGIGLNVVKKLCDSIGISITVESKISKGSIFKLDCSQVIFK